MKLASFLALTVLAAGINSAAAQDLVLAINEGVTSVSYTHLTLPTIYSV